LTLADEKRIGKVLRVADQLLRDLLLGNRVSMLEGQESSKSSGSTTEIEALNDNIFPPHLQE
jgi:hypothetical protein